MLYILFAIFLVMFVVDYVKSDMDIDYIHVHGVVGIVFSFVIMIVIPIVFANYNGVKSTVDKQITILEERNNEIVEQIEPIINRYLNYETDTLTNFKVNSNTVITLSCYPQIKGDEFMMKHINIILKNQEKITELKLNKVSLNSYKLWLFVGE